MEATKFKQGDTVYIKINGEEFKGTVLYTRLSNYKGIPLVVADWNWNKNQGVWQAGYPAKDVYTKD